MSKPGMKGLRTETQIAFILPTLAESETVIWDDGSHMRAFPLAKVIDDEEGQFRFEDARGQVFTLRPLTAALYATRVKAKVGGPILKTDDAVQHFYLAPRGW